ncbi:MAG: tetratricopeptide repeat protein [Candidatus Binatia bacterium]
MVRSHKRITRRDIRRPDQFVTLTGRLFRLFEKHKAAFAGSLALIIAVFLSLWGWNYYTGRQNRLAAEQYSNALALYHDGQYRKALDALDQVKAYRWSTYSRLALLYQANSYIALKEPAKAVAAIQELLHKEKKETFVRQLGLMTLGYAQEAAGQCKEAVQSFAEAEKLQGVFREEALLGRARCSAKSRDFKGALDSYRLHLTNYPTSERNSEILLRIQEIEAKVNEAAPVR